VTAQARPIPDRRPLPWWPAIPLAAHVALLITLKLARGQESELLWISHVSLAIAASGFLLRSTRLLALAFVAIAALHVTWMFDFVVGMSTGSFPVGMAMYLPHADTWTWIATSHHAYLTPLLAISLWRRDVPVMRTFCTAFFLFVYLAVFSRFFLDPQLNVNRSHEIFIGWDHPFAHNSNALPAIKYLPGLSATVAALFLAPSALVLRMLSRPIKNFSTVGDSPHLSEPIADA
jgi:hypothetical protein